MTIRFVESERKGAQDGDALLLSPWPESLYAFEPTWSRLVEHARLVAIDLPGFGHSERRDALMSPRAVDRLVENHARARRLAEGLARIPGIVVRTPRPETNMVFFEVGDAGLSNAEFLDEMLRAGVRMGQVRGQIRAVTHLDVSAEDIELALRAAEGIVKSGRRGSSSDVGGQLRRVTKLRHVRSRAREGLAAGEAALNTCFACRAGIKERDLVFTRYAHFP